jgi:dTDP-4-amino-4,6-dideoxy-D-galactose acyltransferase
MITEANAPCEFLPWDTNFFGCRVGRVRGDTLNEGLASLIDEWAAANSVRVLYLLARSDDPTTTRMAEIHGYNLTDVRVTFERMLESQKRNTPEPVSSSDRIRAARPEDVPSLQEIAASGHTGTRFANDPHFPAERVQAFYAKWIAVECEGRAEQVLVAASGEDNPIGYISCHLDANNCGEIGLVGVNPNHRGNGLGSSLVRGALRWFGGQGARLVTVVTQGNNMAAQRLYQKSGFITRNVQLWYHKWFS